VFQRGINRILGGFFSLFNRVFQRGSERYGLGVLRITPFAESYLPASCCCWSVPGAFFASCRAVSSRVRINNTYRIVQLPDAARWTGRKSRAQISELAKATPGVDHVIGFPVSRCRASST